MTDLLASLNADFGLEGHVHFQAGENGLHMARIDNDLATAEVYLHGGNITAFQPHGSDPLLWLSPLAQFQTDKAIRGGVPVIWPWFGPHSVDSHKPQHGFARTASWQVSHAGALADGSTQLQLDLRDTSATRTLWPHAFALELVFTVGTELRIELTSRNTGDQPFTAGAALHSYFAVGDVEQVVVEGLADCEYIDKLDADRRKRQEGLVRIHAEVDRIYLKTENSCVIHDPLMARQIHIEKGGSRSTVVWNPWADKAEAMADFPDQGFRQMLCIETANAADDVRILAPGDAHTLSQRISLHREVPRQ
ncbi:MAG TPA: D-hexose-6-phosphate mutarotase [Gammaproteobacteria bacterium]|nr:D-hexose-6-phosphate mutarotase [Gammaproteobacteria bacterium]